jgi:hypothetical protein
VTKKRFGQYDQDIQGLGDVKNLSREDEQLVRSSMKHTWLFFAKYK